MHSSAAMERLGAALKRLPGIGEKSASRLAYFLLGAPDGLLLELSEAIARVKTDTAVCERCFNLGESSPCLICSNPDRDAALICVVEEPADLASVEQSGRFRGLYHVLGGTLSPIDGIGSDDLRIGQLVERVGREPIREVILATNPNAEGDATAHFIADRLSRAGITVSRIASGMPLGGDLEYADHVTVGRSIDNRRPLA
ncbi:MAG: recombination protein RecR [bacterium TMED88]|nr:recombination protein RecR [Deltaproteobacteria bacterium]OUV35111.1 MAG: recombination protein RecR [bacterium TMED88]